MICTASVSSQEKKKSSVFARQKSTSLLRSAASATRNAQRDMNPITQVSHPEVILSLPVSEGSKGSVYPLSVQWS